MADTFEGELSIIGIPKLTIAELKTFALTAGGETRKDGSIVYVVETEKLYRWDADSVATDDDINIVKSNLSVTGRWLATAEFINNVVHKVGNETISGTKTFNGVINVPAPLIDTEAATKKYVDDNIQGGVNESHIYYVRSGGLDTYDGKNIADGFLTYSKAFTEVAAQTPSVTNQFSIKTNDGYIYTGSFDMTSTTPKVTYTSVDALNAVIKTIDGTINENCSIHVKEYYRDSGVGYVLIKTGAGKTFLKAEKVANLLGNNGGGIFINEGYLDAEIKDFSVTLRTDTLLSSNPATANKKAHFKGNTAKGKIFTTIGSDEQHFDYQNIDSDFSLNAGSKLYLKSDIWNGNIVASGALTEIYLQYNKRTSDPLNDVLDSTAIVHKISPQEIYHYTSNKTIKATQRGAIITNKGATGNLIHTLPTANSYNDGMEFTFTNVADYQILLYSTGSAFRFIEANGTTIVASNCYPIYKGSTVKLINMGEYGTYGYWYVYVLAGRAGA